MKMHKRVLFTSLMGIFLLSSSSSFAAPKAPAPAPTPIAVHSERTTGLGVASASAVTGTNTSATAYFGLDETRAIQTFAAIAQTSDPFTFGLGGIFKWTVAGNKSAGFHLGAGFGLGTVPVLLESKFAFSIIGNAGIHFSLPGLERILLSFDMGPALSIVDGDANLQLGGLSDLLGFSVVYLF